MSRILDKVKRSATKFVGDVQAVSPVIAVLILVIVAVVGGIAVGMLQTGVTERVTDQAKFGDIGKHELKIIGGPGVTPLVAGPIGPGETISAEDAPPGTLLRVFSEAHPEVKAEFLRECCGFAMYALQQDACDMGMGRRFPTQAEIANYPELTYQVVGKAPIAVIANAGAGITNNETTYTELNTTFMTGTGTVGTATVYPVVYGCEAIEAEWSGGETAASGEVYGTSIQGMFSLYLKRGPSATDWILGGAEDNTALNEEIKANPSNYVIVGSQEEMIEKVANNASLIGFVDYMYAVNAIEEGKDIVILGLDGMTEGIDGIDPDDSPEGIGTADTSNAFGGEGYVTGFGGPMFTPVMVFTSGEPDTYEQALIDSMLMFEGVEAMHEHGFLAGEDIVVSASCPFHTA